MGAVKRIVRGGARRVHAAGRALLGPAPLQPVMVELQRLGDTTEHALRNSTELMRQHLQDLENSAARDHSQLTARADEVTNRVTELGAALTELRADLTQLRHKNAVQSTYLAALGRRQLPQPPYTCVFLVHHIEAWDSLAPVYDEMTQRSDFRPIVVSLARSFPFEDKLVGEDLIHAKLLERDIPHLRFNMTDGSVLLDALMNLAPDVIFRQSGWDNDIHPMLSTENLRFFRMCYVHYAALPLVETLPAGPDYGNGYADSDFFRSVWLRCVSSPAEHDWVADNVALGPQADVGIGGMKITGHPKLARLAQDIAAAPPRQRPEFTILWSPHHSLGDDWIKFGTFHMMALDMVEFARSNPDLHVIFSPHPALTTRLAHPVAPLTADFIAQFEAEWAALPNTSRIAGGGYAETFAHTDLLITDGLSWLIEYQLTKKPLIFLERRDHVGLSPLSGPILEGVERVDTMDAAAQRIRAYADGEPWPLSPIQQRNIEQYLVFPDAARDIVDAIGEQLRSEATPMQLRAAKPTHPQRQTID